jgi:uncharacterized protein (TIRG00374 family)
MADSTDKNAAPRLEVGPGAAAANGDVALQARQAAGGREADQGTENGAADVSLAKRFLNWQTLVSFVVAFAILLFLVTRSNIDVARTLRAIASASPAYFALALVSYYLVFPIRALRWRLMLRNSGLDSRQVPGVGKLGVIVLISWFANCLVPAKLGDVYRAYLLKRWGGVSGSKAGGTIVAERVIDLATLLLLAGAAGLVALRGQSREKLDTLVGPLEVMAALVALAAIALLSMRLWSRWIRGLLPSRVHGLYARFEEGAVGSFGSYHVLLPTSVLVWVCEVLRLFFVTRSIGLRLADSLPTEVAIVTAAALVGSLFTALPLTPAGLGFVESGVVAALVLMGLKDQGLALSVALLDRTISYASVVAFGLIAYLISTRFMRVPARPVALADGAGVAPETNG